LRWVGENKQKSDVRNMRTRGDPGHFLRLAPARNGLNSRVAIYYNSEEIDWKKWRTRCLANVIRRLKRFQSQQTFSFTRLHASETVPIWVISIHTRAIGQLGVHVFKSTIPLSDFVGLCKRYKFLYTILSY